MTETKSVARCSRQSLTKQCLDRGLRPLLLVLHTVVLTACIPPQNYNATSPQAYPTTTRPQTYPTSTRPPTYPKPTNTQTFSTTTRPPSYPGPANQPAYPGLAPQPYYPVTPPQYASPPLSGGVINGLIEKLTIKTGAQAVAISPNDRRIASGGWDNKLTIWDASTQTLTPTLTIPLQGNGDLLLDLAFSPDGSRIVTGSRQDDNYKTPTVNVWDVNSGNKMLTLQYALPEFCSSVAYSPKGSFIAAGCFNQYSAKRTLQVWDANTGRQLLNIDGVNGPVAFSPDETRFTGGHGHTQLLKLWDTRTGQELLTIQGNKFKGFNSVAFSPDGNRIISGNGDGTLKLWDVGTGQELFTFTGHTKTVNDVIFSPDGSRVVSGSADGTLRLWDMLTGKPLAVFRIAKPFQSVGFSADGKHIISGSDDKMLRIFSDGAIGNAQQSGMQQAQQPVYGQVPAATNVPSRKQIVTSSGAVNDVTDFVLYNDSGMMWSASWIDYQGNITQGGQVTAPGNSWVIANGAKTWESHWFAISTSNNVLCSISPRQGARVNFSQLTACQ